MLGTLDTTLNHNNNPGSTPTTSPGTGQCAGVAGWSSATVYLGGDKASYNGLSGPRNGGRRTRLPEEPPESGQITVPAN
ncbi:hypothetical protein H1R20_g9132, partial [Candolleomyces eurysporus]